MTLILRAIHSFSSFAWFSRGDETNCVALVSEYELIYRIEKGTMDLIIEHVTTPSRGSYNVTNPSHDPLLCSLHSKTFYYYPQNRRGTLYSLGLNQYTASEIKDIMQVLDCLLNINFHDTSPPP